MAVKVGAAFTKRAERIVAQAEQWSAR